MRDIGVDVRGGDRQAVQGQIALLGQFHQLGRHPVQFLAGVGKSHRLPHVGRIAPHLEMDHLGAAAELLEPEFFHGGRGFQARDQHPGGEFDPALPQGSGEISREFPGAQPAPGPQELDIDAGDPAAPGHQH